MDELIDWISPDEDGRSTLSKFLSKEWVESQHPRGAGGKFGSGEGTPKAMESNDRIVVRVPSIFGHNHRELGYEGESDIVKENTRGLWLSLTPSGLANLYDNTKHYGEDSEYGLDVMFSARAAQAAIEKQVPEDKLAEAQKIWDDEQNKLSEKINAATSENATYEQAIAAQGTSESTNIVNGYRIEPGAILNEAGLSEANLKGVDLNGAFLREADLENANLSGANLNGANLSEADLNGANLAGASLYYANLTGADLTNANLTNANLSGANLNGASLRSTDLSNADLSNADLTGVYLGDANLSGANLSEAIGVPDHYTKASSPLSKDWDEARHPRGAGGKFGDGEGVPITTDIKVVNQVSGDQQVHVTAEGEPTVHRVLDGQGKPRIELRVDGETVHSFGGNKKVPLIESVVVTPQWPGRDYFRQDLPHHWIVHATSQSEEKAAQIARRESAPVKQGGGGWLSYDARALTVQDETSQKSMSKEFEESKHPRQSDGKFGNGEGVPNNHHTAEGEPTVHRVLDGKGKPRIELRVDGKTVHSIGGGKKIPYVTSVVVKPVSQGYDRLGNRRPPEWDIHATSQSQERAAQIAARESKPVGFTDSNGSLRHTMTSDVRALAVQDETSQ